MRIDISGVLKDNPSSLGKSTSIKLLGNTPFIYAYGNLGDKILSELKQGDAVIASADINYAKDGAGDWQKYINLTGNVVVLPNKKAEKEEVAKIKFVSTGKISEIKPQTTKRGAMARFKVDEQSVSFMGRSEISHHMACFGDVADYLLNTVKDGDYVMVAGTVQRLKSQGEKWYTSFKAVVIKPVEVLVERADSDSGGGYSPEVIDEDDIPF